MAHHDALGLQPAARRPICRSRSSKCIRDAAAAGLAHGGFARVSSPYGACVLKVVVSDGQQRGSLFAPIHWSDETASSARVGELVTPATDPYSGQPEAKATPAAIAPVTFAYRGFALSRGTFRSPPGTWWSKMAVANGNGYLMATNYGPASGANTHWRNSAPAPSSRNIPTSRAAAYRMAAFADGRLAGCLFIGPQARCRNGTR